MQKMLSRIREKGRWTKFDVTGLKLRLVQLLPIKILA